MFPSQRKGRNGNKRVSLKTPRFPPANSETHPQKLCDIGRLPGIPKAMGSLLPGGGAGGVEHTFVKVTSEFSPLKTLLPWQNRSARQGKTV